jgi:hypothetical protein
MGTPSDRFLAMPPSRRRALQELLVEQALARWKAYAQREGSMTYVETVVGTTQAVDATLPERALASVRSGVGVQEILRAYDEPMAALTDGDLVFPDPVLFAYNAIYNFFRRYACDADVDDWLIVSQAGSSEEDERRWTETLAKALDQVERTVPSGDGA